MQAPGSASFSQLASEASDLLHFHTARAALIAYLASADELSWTDKLCQAVLRPLDAGITHFRHQGTRR